MRQTIPFVPFKLRIASRLSHPFVGISEKILKVLPNMEESLEQAELDFEDREYVALAILTAIFWFGIIFSTVFFLGQIILGTSFLLISIVASSSIGALFFAYLIFYPRLIVIRKLRDLDKNLLYGLRDLAVQIKSGVPLFDAMLSISRKDYGRFSEEFKDTVKKISAGNSSVEALEDLASRNPSLNFRRSVWQMVNSIRTGTDLGGTLDSVVSNTSNEQRVQIKKYGSQLNPLAMMYMMLGVILPSLGITFLIILSSFSGFPITQTFFWMILIVLVIFQFAFIGIVKSRRPSIEI